MQLARANNNKSYFMKMINNTTIVNRMATAGEYLAPGDIILQIPAVTSGPARSSKPVCLGCLKPDSVCKLSPCPKCSWPICSPDCSYIDQHKQECNLLQTSNSKCQIENFSDFTNCLDFITPLRLLLKILNERQLLKDVNVNFGDFNRTSKEKEDENIVKSIKNLLKSEDELSIKRCVYICEKYGVPIENGCIGIYENIPSLQHSCSPNTYYSLTKNNREIMFRASVNINSGETINFCKTDMMKCNYFRRKQLQEMGIHCSCLRCMDRGEFGTGFGGLKCDSCQGSLNESLDNGKWSCDSCDKSKNGAECRQVLEKLERKVAHMSKEADASRESVLQFESLLKRVGEWSQVPENSQLLFDIKYRLIFIYQYHKDFYHLEEDYLTVHFLKIQPFTRILKHFNINVEKVKLLLGVDSYVRKALQRKKLCPCSHSI